MVEANYISNTIYIVLNAGRQKNFLNVKIIIILISVIIIPTIYYMNQPLYQNYGQRFYFYYSVVFFVTLFFKI